LHTVLSHAFGKIFITMRARHSYPTETIRFNHHYKDISIFEDALNSHMDYNLFDELVAELVAEDINSEKNQAANKKALIKF